MARDCRPEIPDCLVAPPPNYCSSSAEHGHQGSKRKRSGGLEISEAFKKSPRIKEESPPVKEESTAIKKEPLPTKDESPPPNQLLKPANRSPTVKKDTYAQPIADKDQEARFERGKRSKGHSSSDETSNQEIKLASQPVETIKEVAFSSTEIVILRHDGLRGQRVKELEFKISIYRLLDLHLYLKVSRPTFLSVRFTADIGILPVFIRIGSKCFRDIITQASDLNTRRRVPLFKQIQHAASKSLQVLNENSEVTRISIDKANIKIYERGLISQNSLGDIEAPADSDSILTVPGSSFTLRRTPNNGIKGRILALPSTESLFAAFLQSQQDGLRPVIRNGYPYVHVVRAKCEGSVKEQMKEEIGHLKVAYEKTPCYLEMMQRFSLCQAALEICGKPEKVEVEVKCDEDGIIKLK